MDWCVDPMTKGTAHQVYLAIRSSIVSGTATAGLRLPASRVLAARLGISRTTVVAAYERLLANGYVEGRAGSGTFVSANFAELKPSQSSEKRRSLIAPPAAQALETIVRVHARPDDRPFNLGRTLLDAHVAETWKRLVNHAARSIDKDDLGYADPRGSFEMRTAVCETLRVVRGIQCNPEQVLITAGTQQATDIAIRVLLRPLDEVWVEDPGYPLVHGQLLLANMQPTAIPVDSEGINVAFGRRVAPNAKAAFVTPSSQYPTGVRMSMQRRIELLEWARKHDAFIIEDDYASEFRFSGPPVSTLYDLDRNERVIYAGTLNKALFPGLRLGFVVVPSALVSAFARVRLLIDRQPPSFQQRIATRFLADGHFTVHVKRMRQAYRGQRDALGETIARHTGGLCEVRVPDQGMHLLIYLSQRTSDIEIEESAQRQGVVARAISRLYHEAIPQSALMLGFAGYPISSLVPAALKLATIIAEKS
jgi:GntR family transcriptional regulator / MocR family aminotransferase